jgi:copper(I)-binding protein
MLAVTAALGMGGISAEVAAMDMSNMEGMQMVKPAPASPAGPVAKVGDLTISGAFARAMLPGQPTGGGYLTIVNAGSAPDTLLAASSPAAGVVSLHEMKMNGNVMEMRPLPGGITIPAGGSVSLTPSGLHLMFEKVTTPFKQGTSVPLTLSFARAGQVTLSLPVGSVGAMAPGT